MVYELYKSNQFEADSGHLGWVRNNMLDGVTDDRISVFLSYRRPPTRQDTT